MLERVGLSDKAKSYPVGLSGGQAQRVSLARAFLFESDVILMDEPFTALDLKLKKELNELFFDVWKKDKRTVIFVTHDVDEAVCSAHRILVINRGTVVYDKRADGEPPRALNVAEKLRDELVSALL